MAKPIYDHRLTNDHTSQDAAIQHTHAGQAHFADLSGDKSCKQCDYFQWGKDDEIAPFRARCIQYRKLRGKWGAMIPGDAFACRHFIPKASKANNRTKDGAGEGGGQ